MEDCGRFPGSIKLDGDDGKPNALVVPVIFRSYFSSKEKRFMEGGAGRQINKAVSWKSAIR